MTCAEARRAILDADPSELEGRGEEGLARHLRGCSRCRAMARTVLDEEEALARGLAGAVMAPDLDALITQALGPEARPRTIRFPNRRYFLTLLPVAAAAAMVALFLGSEPQLPGDPYLPAETAPGLGLEVPEGQNVAVLATNDPDITVLWLF